MKIQALSEVALPDLQPNHHYAVICEGYDADEQPVKFNDMVWVDNSTVPGQGTKKIRQIRFCRFPKVLVLNQVVGCRFFRPVEFDTTEENKPAMPVGSALASFLGRSGK